MPLLYLLTSIFLLILIVAFLLNVYSQAGPLAEEVLLATLFNTLGFIPSFIQERRSSFRISDLLLLSSICTCFLWPLALYLFIFDDN